MTIIAIPISLMINFSFSSLASIILINFAFSFYGANDCLTHPMHQTAFLEPQMFLLKYLLYFQQETLLI